MYCVYVLYSERVDQYFIGQTVNLTDRIGRHNTGKSLSTRKGIPWRLVTKVEFESKTNAIKAENWLKRMKSRRVKVKRSIIPVPY